MEDYRWASGVGESGFPYLLAGPFHGTVSGFSALDYFNAGTVTSGPITVTTLAGVASSASYEQGPLAPGSLVTATAGAADWPMTLGGATVTVTDAAGASATITGGDTKVTSKINVQPVYPHLFLLNRAGLAAATVTRVRNGLTSTEEVYTAALGAVAARPIALGSDEVYLTLYGSGLGSAASATATIGGVAATVQYAGPQGTYGGLDQYNILVPASLAGRGKVDVGVTAGGKPSNPVNITVQ